MITFPHCKINLGLHITGKRPDGFHSLESVFLKVPLHDVLEVTEQKESDGDSAWSFESSGIAFPGDASSNLVIKAYEVLKDLFSLPPVKIFLHKIIPMGAGLGGGSSDGAFMLKLLNRKFGLNIPASELMELAVKLGSDCPFFIDDDSAYVTGRGEVTEPFPVNLKDYFIVLVNPGIHVGTAEAFGMIKPQSNRPDIRRILEKDIQEWKDDLINDFEKPVANKYPEIMRIKQRLHDAGALYSSMTGSGSTVFGIFKDKPDLNIFPENYFVWVKKY